VKVRAEAQPVDVLGQRVDDVVIDPGIDVDELRVVLAGGGMLEVRGARGLPKPSMKARMKSSCGFRSGDLMSSGSGYTNWSHLPAASKSAGPCRCAG
jgi:hypothetical protein